ncbi:MAG TPA: glycine cleavage system aminomethyltransferase GcvT, partial [Acidimicrobiia bacterium]|nr:glycine cleavage system aminomethyltransferase GcvT [Acidimicrobiia bacterium]
MNRSPLHDLHQQLGARFVDFGGWEMPVQYGSVLAEHRAVRASAGWFDVTHLGRFELTGTGAEQALLRLLSNDITKIAPGRTQYTLMLDDRGGIVDDLVIWCWGPDRYWVFPNAANHHRVMAAFSSELGCEVRDLQTVTVLIAIQGPQAPSVIEELFGEAPRRFHTASHVWESGEVRLAGTGYTGERGGEVSTDPDTGRHLADRLVSLAVVPCGLASRDTLRLEAGLPLWGSDIDESTTPLEAGLDFAVDMGHDFRGRPALEAQMRDGPSRRLIGFVLDDKGIPRHGHKVRTPRGAGEVTSGNLSPLLDTGIGLAYLSPPTESEAAEIEVQIRERWVKGHIVEPP